MSDDARGRALLTAREPCAGAAREQPLREVSTLPATDFLEGLSFESTAEGRSQQAACEVPECLCSGRKGGLTLYPGREPEQTSQLASPGDQMDARGLKPPA